MTAQDAREAEADCYDIVIVGAGPAGLMLSACLARWGYRIKHVDNRLDPTHCGRADGIQPRTMDLFRNMGLKSKLMAHNPARIYEVAFWKPGKSSRGIIRSGTWATCPDFINARYPFTTTLHQGFIEQVLIDDLEGNGIEIQRPWTIAGFRTDERDLPGYPVQVQLKHVNGTPARTVRAKYLFGGEGAKSIVRQQLGINLQYHEPIKHVWAVMDGVVETNFPDIMMKCTVHSPHGSMMIIPREGGIVRLYVQLASLNESDWNARTTATEEQVQESAKRILDPYRIAWERVEWYSIYPISQGISDRYSLDQRVFLGGDACHTHSPKAGQGMNTAFLDALNLAWKIHVVEGGMAHRDVLKTYESERRAVAENLLDFDNRYAKLFSQHSSATQEAQAASSEKSRDDEFVKVFKEACEFTSGYGVVYEPNVFNWSTSHEATSILMHPEGSKLQTGRLLPNADVTRVLNANKVRLEQAVPLNGSFRVFVFAGSPSSTRVALRDFAVGLRRKDSFYGAFTRPDVDTVSPHEQDNPHSLFFTMCTVFAAKRAQIDITRDVPGPLARYRYHVYADDRWDRCQPGAEAAAHSRAGIDTERGAVIVVRPDGYVGAVIGLTQGRGTVDSLNDYFAAFCSKILSNVASRL